MSASWTMLRYRSGVVGRHARSLTGSTSQRPCLRPWPWLCTENAVKYSSSGTTPRSITLEKDRVYKTDEWMNTPSTILSAIPRRLHLQQDHPLSITRQLIESRFPSFRTHNGLFPVVSTYQNFDSLGFPPDHVGRNRTDTYYLNKDTVLRTHTSAHEADTFRSNESEGYLISADVYRRDAIDRTHYPIFHQMEGARTWDRNAVAKGKSLDQMIWQDITKIPKHDIHVEDLNPTFHAERNPLQECHSAEEVEAIAAHLKRSLEDVVVAIFNAARGASASAAAAAGTNAGEHSTAASTSATTDVEPLKVRWVEAYFPFTSPSWELEVFWQGDWLEVLGSGITQQSILNKAGVSSRLGWAFGLGLERIAMLLYSIPDIRLFWSMDPRFLCQFSASTPVQRFVPFSKHPACFKDVSFWLPSHSTGATPSHSSSSSSSATPSAAGGLSRPADSAFHENDVMEIARELCGDMVEDVRLVDEFVHPKTGRKSLCYRTNYRSLERTLTNEETNELHERFRQQLVEKLGVELR